MNFENFTDYLVSLNISQLCREYGFKKIGIESLYLLTKVVREYIKSIAVSCKEFAELSGRNEVNLIDTLSVLASEKNTFKITLLNYIRESKFKYNYSKRHYISKILCNEQLEREKFLRKININNIINSKIVNKELIDFIPAPLKYFPKDFALKESDLTINVTGEEVKKNQLSVKYTEKKAIEEVISSNNYFDNLSKKHKRKNSIDINNLYNEVHETNVNYELGTNIQSLVKSSYNNTGNKEENKQTGYEGLGYGQ